MLMIPGGSPRARHATVAVLSLALSTACGTARGVRLDTGQGVPLEHTPLASTTPVLVETGAFEEALSRLVLAGGTALLASRMAMLPSFTRVAAVGASGLGINLAGLGQVSAVTVVGSTVVISLPAAAVAMAATGVEAAGGGAKALSNEAQRGIRSLEKRIAEHEKKLADFKANPTVRPGMEGQPKEVIEAAQQSRIRHLEKEIQTLKENIEKLRRGE
jgi:hypothetical protein